VLYEPTTWAAFYSYAVPSNMTPKAMDKTRDRLKDCLVMAENNKIRPELSKLLHAQCEICN